MKRMHPGRAGRVRRWAFVAGLIGSMIGALAADTPTNSAPPRVLLITGIDYPGHKWQETTPVLVEALHETALQVDVLEDPYRLGAFDLSSYRAVLLHFMNWERPDPDEAAKENLRRFVERGGGMVMVHFACGAFGSWPEFRNLAGRVYDKTNTHDPRGPFTVQVVSTNHPITRGLETFDVDDELYTCLAGEKPIELLATARSKVTKRDHPMAFVHTYGKGRVFQTPLGHDVKALRSGKTLELIRRGTLWAAQAGAENPRADRAAHAEIESGFKLPAGFGIQLVAAEPHIVNPMSICVDDDGVLWVTEAHTYRWGTNGSPFQPPTNPIKRIEPGKDGRAANVVVAARGFPEPVIGIAAHRGKIYATCLNELLGFDVAPDGTLTNRQVLVTDAARPWNPFGMYRVQVGPDDKLWLCIADHPATDPVTLTGSDGRRVRLAGRSGGLVRCERDGSRLEVVAHGFRAPYAFDIDPWGHVWHISNGEGSPNLFVHVIPGVDYGYASRNASYSWLAGTEPLSPPVRDMGAGANTAALHYYSSMFPQQYQGNILIANWGSHGENPSNREIKRYRRAHGQADRTGTSDSELEEVETFLQSSDSRFRPTGLALAPDGGLYVIDWHGRDDENDATGRIIKIISQQGTGDETTVAASHRARPAVPGPAGMVELLGHANHLVRAKAMHVLEANPDAAIPLLANAAESGEALSAANAIWVLSRMNVPAAAQALTRGVRNADARVRAHATRQLRQLAGQTLAAGDIAVLAAGSASPDPLLSASQTAALTAPLRGDPDAEVRMEAALAQASSDAITKGILAVLKAAPNPRLVYQAGFQLSLHADAATVMALAGSEDPAERSAALVAIDHARHANTPLLSALAASAPALLDEAPPAGVARKIAWLLQHRPGELDAEWARLDAGSLKLVGGEERRAVLEQLAAAPPRVAPVAFLLASLRDPDGRVQQAALRALRLAAADHPELCAATLHLARAAKDQSLRLDAVWTLGVFRSGVKAEDWMALLDTNDHGLVALRAMRQGGDSPLLAKALVQRAPSLLVARPELAEEVALTLQWVGASPQECDRAGVMPAAARVPAAFAQSVLRRVPGASARLGRLSFESGQSGCMKCHATRSADRSFGPNLASIGAAAQPDYLLESIMAPSALIKTGFEVETIQTTDGRAFTGMVEPGADGFGIRISVTEKVHLRKEEMAERAPARVSLMPEGLDAAMSAGELADVIAYMLSLKESNSAAQRK